MIAMLLPPPTFCPSRKRVASRELCVRNILYMALIFLKSSEALFGATPSRMAFTMATGLGIERQQLPTGEFTLCWPVGLGQYNGRPAVFLARHRRILDPRDEVLPIPITESAVPLLSEAMQPRNISLTVVLRMSVELFGRSGSMYDNLPWHWSSDSMVKREAFQRSQGKGLMGIGFGKEDENSKTFGSAYDLLLDVATNMCPARILSLVIEEEDSSSGRITLGGAAHLQRRPDLAQGVLGREKTMIEITTDEAVGIALSLGQQVHVDRDIWEGGSLRPRFFMSGDGKMRMDLDVEGDEWDNMFKEREAVPDEPPAWTIKSRGALFRMPVEQKRRCLRSSGGKPPRRRWLSGVESKDNRDLEDMLLPFMDEAVRRDVLLARAWRSGDFVTAGELCEGKSERHVVAEQLQAAMKDQDEELAKILVDRLEILESCRMDSTLDVGSYQKDLDADEWYLRNRRASFDG